MANEPLNFDVPPEMEGYLSPKIRGMETLAILHEEGRIQEVSEGEVSLDLPPEQQG
jgi:hypothetical protein